MGLISARFMTAQQLQRCCLNDLSPEVIGYALFTGDNRRIGTVDDVLVDDETFTIRFLVVDTASAEFIVNQPYVLLTSDLCCWDAENKVVRSQATVQQVQDAPAFDRAIDLVEAYERTTLLRFGERPSAPADH
ncbi:MAG TPA: PRC-barrel domain-containing protein [Anaerolineae bacterium]|nr:PRC-barrel domain-containing protein [Anaerolineae bacterium]HOQ97613.1 PRC-barrel domain-containing protein [Anaerolineae bacterium]HPL26553.1 PRC-barrel domain-containing protein [Anaerolineae bacterium]HPL26556.1 PRC-barrel domain-containing protein [Anaerolineae bacterium]